METILELLKANLPAILTGFIGLIILVGGAALRIYYLLKKKGSQLEDLVHTVNESFQDDKLSKDEWEKIIKYFKILIKK